MPEEQPVDIVDWFDEHEPGVEDAEALVDTMKKDAEVWTFEQITAENYDENIVRVWFEGKNLDSVDAFLETFCEVQDDVVTIHGVCTVQNDVEEEQIAEEDSKLVYDRLIEEADDSGFKDKLTKLAKKVNPGTLSPTISEGELLDIGLGALQEVDFGGFDDAEIDVFTKVLPSLKTLPSFRTVIPCDRLWFDTANYRLAQKSSTTMLVDTVKPLLDALTIDEIEKGQSQVRELIYKSGEKDEFKILNLASNIERRGFREEFPLVVVALKHGEIRDVDAQGDFVDQLEFKEGDGMYFLIADGNRRGSAATLITQRHLDGEYDITPAKKASVDRLVNQGVPCIVHLAHDMDDVHRLRKEIQTAHHRIGQLKWQPYADAYNLQERFKELKSLGFEASYCLSALSEEMDIEKKALKRELRSLDLLEKAVEEEIIERKDVQKHFGMTKNYILDGLAAGKFFGFENGPNTGYWPEAGSPKEEDFKSFLKFVFSDDVVQVKESGTNVRYADIKTCLTYNEGSDFQAMLDGDCLTVEGVREIVQDKNVQGGTKNMAMAKFLRQMKRKLQQQNWAEDEDIYASWDEQPRSSEQQLLESILRLVETVTDAIVQAKADNSTADWKEAVEDIIRGQEKEHGSSGVKMALKLLELSNAPGIDAFIADLDDAGLDGLGIALRLTLDSAAEGGGAPQEDPIASASDDTAAGGASSEGIDASD